METHQEFIAKKEKQFEKETEKSVKMKDIARKGIHEFKREKWTFMVQHNLENKVFVIERLRRTELPNTTPHQKLKIDDIEYRIGYFIVGKNGNKTDKWTWGQYCPMIPATDLKKLLEKAKKEGTLLE